MPIPVSELQKINPSSVIELFTLTLDSTLHGSTDVQRFHAGSNNLNNGDVIWQGNTYTKLPCQAEGFEFDGAGGVKVKLALSKALASKNVSMVSESVSDTTKVKSIVLGF